MKTLANRFVLFMAVTALLMPGLALAATGPGDGPGPIHDILGGTPFTYTGVIVSLNGMGTGFTLDAGDDGMVVIFGLGPEWYWESLGAERPDVGDEVTVEGFAVDFNGVSRNIAMTVVLADGTQVVLRDPETGLPLWAAAQKKIKRLQNRARYEWNHRSE